MNYLKPVQIYLSKEKNISTLENYLENRFLSEEINRLVTLDIFHSKQLENNVYIYKNGKSDIDLTLKDYFSFFNLHPLVKIKDAKFLHSRFLLIPIKIKQFFVNECKISTNIKLKLLIESLCKFFEDLNSIRNFFKISRISFKTTESVYSSIIKYFIKSTYLTSLLASYALKQLVIYKISSAFRRLGYSDVPVYKIDFITNSGDCLKC